MPIPVPAFLVTYGVDFGGVKAVRFPTAEAAAAALPVIEDESAYILTSAEDCKKLFGGPTLAALYSRLSGKKVMRFENSTVGAARLFNAIMEGAQEPPVLKESKVEQESIKQGGGASPKLFKYDSVFGAVKENPYREGTLRHKAYSVYRVGMTARQALDAGAKPYDINRVIKSGHVTID